jgi:hypothetical protein
LSKPIGFTQSTRILLVSSGASPDSRSDDTWCLRLVAVAQLAASAAIFLGVSGDIVGRAVNAVLIPPQAERFASRAGVDLDRLVLNVSGWNKLVLVDSDRVFLFPRSAIGVEWFERELAAYRALAGAQPPRHHDASYHRWLRRALDPATCVSAAAEAAGRLDRPARASAWADLLACAAQLAPVLVHGDIHEDQLADL